MAENDDRLGVRATPVKSNITDNESAKMATSHGVVQGYNGIVASDDKHQVIVYAHAFGDSNKSGHLPEIFKGLQSCFNDSAIDTKLLETVKVTADSGFHNEKGMEFVFKNQIDAYIADNQFRKRDIRLANFEKYKKKSSNW